MGRYPHNHDDRYVKKSDAPATINAWAHGVRPSESATNNVTRLEAIIAEAGTPATTPVLIELGGNLAFGGATIVLPAHVGLQGWGVNPANLGTVLFGLSIAIGATVDVAAYAHGTILRDFQMRNSPSHAIEWRHQMAENAVMDRITVTDAGGDSFRLSVGGVPTQIRSLASFRAGGAGLRLVGAKNVSTIGYLSGDENTDGLLVIEDAHPDGEAVVSIGAIKSENNQPVVDLSNNANMHVHIGAISLADTVGFGDGVTPVIRQGGGASATIEVDTFRYAAPRNFSTGYHDTNTGDQVSIADLREHGIDTRPRLHVVTGGGLRLTPQPIFTGSVGTSETTLLHNLGYTPTIVAVVPDADATIWQSSPADSSALYLTASAACDATIVLDRATPMALGERVMLDDFTGSDGSISGRSPTVGAGTWSVWNVANIASNRLTFTGGDQAALYDTGAADVVIDATMNFGDYTGTRLFGFIFRRTDASNYWRMTLRRSDTGVGWVVVDKIVAGSSTSVAAAGSYTDPGANTDFAARLEVRGAVAKLSVNGTVALEQAITSEHAAATVHGILSRTFATNITAPTADDVTMYAL